MTENVVYVLFASGLLAGWIGFVWSKGPYWSTIQRIAKALLLIAAALNLLVVALILIQIYQRYEFINKIFATNFHKVILFLFDGVIICFCAAEYVRVNILRKTTPPQFDGEGFVKNMRWVMASYFLGTSIGKILFFDAMLQFFQLSGYSRAFLWFITIVEGVGAIGLMLRRTAIYVTVVLLCDMFGATYTHYHNYFSQGIPDPFSNSLDSLKMIPFLTVILIATMPKRKAIQPQQRMMEIIQ